MVTTSLFTCIFVLIYRSFTRIYVMIFKTLSITFQVLKRKKFPVLEDEKRVDSEQS